MDLSDTRVYEVGRINQAQITSRGVGVPLRVYGFEEAGVSVGFHVLAVRVQCFHVVAVRVQRLHID
jgi:hypothetical protein